MLYSMTGFGRSVAAFRQHQLTIQIKSLNSKYLDINLKLPTFLQEKEFEFRNLLKDKLLRGKLDCIIQLEGSEEPEATQINEKKALEYLEQLKAFCEKANLETDNLLDQVLRMPQVIESKSEDLQKEEWEAILQAAEKALDKVLDYRLSEGKALQKDFEERLKLIQEEIAIVEEIEPQRRKKKREKIENSLNELAFKDYDQSRLEQELVYYIEKADINEELSRLKSHCEYFYEILQKEEPLKGKKLGFLTQELGREINTLGAKANDAEMQKHVVLMKEEMEKIKEQVNNAL